MQQLRVLAEVARTGSYTSAAAALGYTQPAVSYHMRRLQRSLGAPAVVRTGRGLQLTELGRVLLQHAETIFAALRAADLDMSSAVARGGGLVRIAAFQSICVALLPAVIARLRVARPDVQVTVLQVEPVEARRLVQTGEADIGLLCDWANESLPDGESTMSRIELLTDRRCVLVRTDHPLAGRTCINLAELADQSWVMESFRDRFEAACTSAGFVPKVVATVDDVLTIHTLVAAGLGIGLMSELALGAHLPAGLAYRPLADWPLRRTYALMWPDMTRVSAVSAVLHEIRSAAGSIGDPGDRPAVRPSAQSSNDL